MWLIPVVTLSVVMFVGMWKAFEKAGQAGWSCLVPIYNLYVTLQIAGRPGWWLLFAFIPLLNLVMVILPFDIARNFGKSIGFGFGLLFLPFIFWPILGFGEAQYQAV